MPWPATRCLCMLSTWLLFVLLVPCALLSIVCPLPSRSPQSPLQCPLRSGSPQNPLKNPLLSSGGYLLHPGGILPCPALPALPWHPCLPIPPLPLHESGPPHNSPLQEGVSRAVTVLSTLVPATAAGALLPPQKNPAYAYQEPSGSKHKNRIAHRNRKHSLS